MLFGVNVTQVAKQEVFTEGFTQLQPDVLQRATFCSE